LSEDLFSNLTFRYPFRKYQRIVLERIAEQVDTDHKFHIVAPPGSGKTIVGLELVRRFGRPAVVFAPTTTIQQQWQSEVSKFTDDFDWIAGHTSLEAARLADITCLTYQVLSTPGENLEFVERIALDRWVEDLVTSNPAETLPQARRRIAKLQVRNPDAFRREISRRYRRVKRDLLRRGEVDGRRFLHPNAQDLIDRIVAQGTGTLVLDECHHLLDYWAFILRELIRSLPGVRVIGLTATLPDPSNATEYENYTALLGAVDFEVPTPAVVKEGNLAPYRYLAAFCQPSRRERDYLERIQTHFETAVEEVTGTYDFQQWLRRVLFWGNEDEGDETGKRSPRRSFEALFRRDPLLCIAATKVLLAQDKPLLTEVPIIDEMMRPITMDDWLALLEAYALRVLKVSPDPDQRRLYRRLRQALLPFGAVITERGIRRQRSPGDLVMALSESKAATTVEILRAEAQALGERLRAVVITDFERLSARSRRLRDVLDPAAGSAVQAFRHLIADPETNALDPVLVTGRVVLADADNQGRLDRGLERWVAEKGVDLTWTWKLTDDPRILQLAGRGSAWSSRIYVALVTDLFEEGVTRCLVGTRGIFGEGWDALSLNTLVDLTSVTSRTGVQQLQGRSLRLDPQWPRKVAHNWDVVCYSPAFEKGDADLRRFRSRHQHVWGVVPPGTVGSMAKAAAAEAAGKALPATLAGRVVRGVPHVDVGLAADLRLRPYQEIDFEAVTARMLDAVDEREATYNLWNVGAPYDDEIYTVARIEPRVVNFHTAATVRRSLRALDRRLGTTLLGFVGLFLLQVVLGLVATGLPWLPLVFAMGLAGLGGLALVNGQAARRIVRRGLVSVPTDDVLVDVGRALLAGLQEAGLVGDYLATAFVRVERSADDGQLEVFVDYATPEDSATFSRAYSELMGPLADARYLIVRDLQPPRSLLHRLILRLVNRGDGNEGPAYHRVPDVLASHRDRAEALADHWRQTVGGGELVYTHTDEGRRTLLEARAQRRRRARRSVFEFWR
jgi:superfamily II DNA or RNA helicase